MSASGNHTPVLDTVGVMEIIPHRPPFLLVDAIDELEPGVRAVGRKAVTMNEPYFVGHFPGRPVMPGVLQLEALAQVGAVALLSAEANKGKLAFFAAIDEVRFKSPVYPGETLTLTCEIESLRGRFGKGRAKAAVGSRAVCQGLLTFALVDQEG